MRRLSRPWDLDSIKGRAFGPRDCLLSEVEEHIPNGLVHSTLMGQRVRMGSAYANRRLLLHPYPRRGKGAHPDRTGFPVRPHGAQEAQIEEEGDAQEALRRMREVLNRVEELEEAFDDPALAWRRLREAWDRAGDEACPRMAEIVRQSRETEPRLRELETRLRKVLQRTRGRVGLARVQELDRASMLWLARQPGRNIAERAGASQRIAAPVREESFDTPENRVLRAYCRLAAAAAHEWMREHQQAKASPRYQRVEAFRRRCRRLDRELDELGVAVAPAGIVPNYVLMQDPAYRYVHQAWLLLLRRDRARDDLWAWQAQTWTDFAVLAVILAMDELEEAELVAQSPVVWQPEAVAGRRFLQDTYAAVYWLKEARRIVEILPRPKSPSPLQTLSRAHVSIRVSDLDERDLPPRIAVWTPHAMERLDLERSVEDASVFLSSLQGIPHSQEVLRDGLILTPARGRPQSCVSNPGRPRVTGIAFDASGPSLKFGLDALAGYVRSDIFGRRR